VFHKYEVFSHHAPFLMRFFPKAKVLPIMISGDIPNEDLVVLRKWIEEKSNMANTLIVAGMNFENFVPKNVAEFQSLSAVNAVQSFDFSSIKNLNVDSP